jgi:putative transposase
MIWLSAQQIADAAAAGLMPGLPATKRRVNALADRERWADTPHARLREGRDGGGGLEYHVDLLPAPARSVWLAHHAKVDPRDCRPPLSDGPVDPVADARSVLLRLIDRFKVANAMPQTPADAMFCEMFNARSMDLPAWIAEAVPSLSPRTVARWRKAVVQGAPTSGRGRPAGSGILETANGGEVRSLILGALVKHPFVNAKHLRKLVKDKFGTALEAVHPQTGVVTSQPLPSLRTFQIALSRWKDTYRNEMMRLTDPDKYRSAVRFSATGSQRADRLNECWQIDASPADVMLKGGRHSIYMAVDVFSRRAIILVSPTPRASAVGLLVRKCLMAWGVPEIIHTDNGSDFVAHQTQRLFRALGIEIKLSRVFTPEDKGIVERAIRTFQTDVAVLPGFIGHSVADRKVIENRKAFSRRLGQSDIDAFGVDLDIREFQSWCDDWAGQTYAHDVHSALKRTPFEMAASYAGDIRRIEHEAALDVLLAPIATGGGMRTVTKTGVRVDGANYLPFAVFPGTQVLVRMDPADLGRVMLFHPETEQYLGEAINAELAGLNPAEVAAKSKAMQSAFEKQQMTDIRKAYNSLGPRDLANAIQRDGAERAGVMVQFPRPGQMHSTPALVAAAEAAMPRRVAAPARPSVSAEEHAAFIARHGNKTNVVKKPEDPRERFRRALRLEDRIAASEAVDPEEIRKLRSYQQSAEYKAHRRIWAANGDAMFG